MVAPWEVTWLELLWRTGFEETSLVDRLLLLFFNWFLRWACCIEIGWIPDWEVLCW